MAKLIIAVDPGKTTGLATLDATTQDLTTAEYGFNDTCSYVAQKASEYGSDLLLVCESFIIGPQTAKNTQAPWSLELIGVMRYLSRSYCGRDLALQTPATAKRFSSDVRLKEVGFWTPGKGHANDAARHLLLFLVQRGLLENETVARLVDIA